MPFLAAGGVVVLVLIILAATGTFSGSSTSGKGSAGSTGSSSTTAAAHCGPSGCAVVDAVQQTPRVNVLHGASCDGLRGNWYLNAIQGGVNVVRPIYRLTWSFAGGNSTAKPNGTISVISAGGKSATVTLANGTLSLTGSAPGHAIISATGTLTVQITGSSSAPKLQFTETGLSGAESELGLYSPFNVDGKALVVPVKVVSHLNGC